MEVGWVSECLSAAVGRFVMVNSGSGGVILVIVLDLLGITVVDRMIVMENNQTWF